jgi:hypothetical protein
VHRRRDDSNMDEGSEWFRTFAEAVRKWRAPAPATRKNRHRMPPRRFLKAPWPQPPSPPPLRAPSCAALPGGIGHYVAKPSFGPPEGAGAGVALGALGRSRLAPDDCRKPSGFKPCRYPISRHSTCRRLMRLRGCGMACGWMVRSLGTTVLTGLVWGSVLTCGAQGQSNELVRLRSEVYRLQSQGKYSDAVSVAKRYVALARQNHGEAHQEIRNCRVLASRPVPSPGPWRGPRRCPAMGMYEGRLLLCINSFRVGGSGCGLAISLPC